MTDPLTRLHSRPEYMQTREWLDDEIRHEEHLGVHTYHDCKCGRGSCRTNFCAKCLREMLDVAKKLCNTP